MGLVRESRPADERREGRLARSGSHGFMISWTKFQTVIAS